MTQGIKIINSICGNTSQRVLVPYVMLDSQTRFCIGSLFSFLSSTCDYAPESSIRKANLPVKDHWHGTNDIALACGEDSRLFSGQSPMVAFVMKECVLTTSGHRGTVLRDVQNPWACGETFYQNARGAPIQDQ